jgi:hypothetical protein
MMVARLGSNAMPFFFGGRATALIWINRSATPPRVVAGAGAHRATHQGARRDRQPIPSSALLDAHSVRDALSAFAF